MSSLTMIARQYLIRGRGYAASISQNIPYPAYRPSQLGRARSRRTVSGPPPRRGAIGGQSAAKTGRLENRSHGWRRRGRHVPSPWRPAARIWRYRQSGMRWSNGDAMREVWWRYRACCRGLRLVKYKQDSTAYQQ